MVPGKRLSELDIELHSNPQTVAAQTGLGTLALSLGMLLLVLLTPGKMHLAVKQDSGPAGFFFLAQHSSQGTV